MRPAIGRSRERVRELAERLVTCAAEEFRKLKEELMDELANLERLGASIPKPPKRRRSWHRAACGKPFEDAGDRDRHEGQCPKCMDASHGYRPSGLGPARVQHRRGQHDPTA